jgi:hypothetical protein
MSNRVVHWFTLPQNMLADAPEMAGVRYARFGVIELTVQEEMTSARMAGQDAVTVGIRNVMMAVRYITDAQKGNQRELSLADESAETFWAKMSPKVRTLLLQAYSRVHAPPPSAAEDFLGSCEASVT